MESNEDKHQDLPGPWREIQAAIWLIGLAILFWQGWFWPGILVLVAISGIFAAVVNLVIKPKQALTQSSIETSPEVDGANQSTKMVSEVQLPSRCQNCGAPISNDSVSWSQDHKQASCPYCKSNLKASG